MAELVTVARDEPIAITQINRPDVMNALNEEVLQGLALVLPSLRDG